MATHAPSSLSVPKPQSPKIEANPLESRIFLGKAESKLGKTGILNVEQIKWLMTFVLPPNLESLSQKYRLSEANGFSAEKFHNYCDNKAPLLVLCQSNTGNIFGGVSFVPFNVEGTETNRNLIFSLDKKSVHYLKNVNGSKKSTQAVRDDRNCGPIFGQKDLLIGDNCHNRASCSSDLGDVYQFDGDGTTYLTGAQFFSLKKVIIFQMLGCNNDPLLP